MDGSLLLGAFGIGVVVGLTGMGGGALMTPMLVLLFGVPPLTAVSSDLVASAVMKPVGSVVHFRRRTVNVDIVKWLCLSSVPCAFVGALILNVLAASGQIQEIMRVALGAAILLTAVLLIVRSYIGLVSRGVRHRTPSASHFRNRPIHVKVLPTILLGAIGGLVVGMTSVGSGSLIIIGLMLLYPGLKMNQLVGTDLMQAVPLVMAAALGHVFYGDLDLAISVPLILGGMPGAYLGARLSATLPGGIVKRALAFMLLASGLKLLNVPTVVIGILLTMVAVGGSVLWMQLRRYQGLPALAAVENRRRRAPLPEDETTRTTTLNPPGERNDL